MMHRTRRCDTTPGARDSPRSRVRCTCAQMGYAGDVRHCTRGQVASHGATAAVAASNAASNGARSLMGPSATRPGAGLPRGVLLAAKGMAALCRAIEIEIEIEASA